MNEKIINYANKYRSILTDNEYEYLINRNYKISNFFMNPKLHKSKELNKIIENQNSEYINITKNLQIEGRPIVAGPVYYISGISQILHLILEHYIFEELTKNINFLDANLKIINNKLHFDVYQKPTNSFSYLDCKSCHPTHTKNNIALSLARHIVRIVTDNTNNRLQELKGHLLKRKHPEKIIDYSFTKLFQPRKHENNDKNVITFTRTYNPNHQFSFNKFKNCIKNTTNRELHLMINKR